MEIANLTPSKPKIYSRERVTWHYKNISRIRIYNRKPEPMSLVPRAVTPCGRAANATVHICNIARNANDERNAGVDDAVDIDRDILCYH